MSIDNLALRFGNDVVEYIGNWMRGAGADDVDFHRYRMRLFSAFSAANSSSEKLILLINKVSPRMKFELLEVISDKVMGESISRYIFARIMVALNEAYRKALDHEIDRVKAEINTLQQRTSELKVKIDHH